MSSPDWTNLLIGAVPPLLLNVYQFLFPRSLSRLKYRVVDETRPAEAGLVEMRGKRFEVVSCGNRAASSILVHIVMKQQVLLDFLKVETSVKVNRPYGSRAEEINIPIPSLNPGEKVIIKVYNAACDLQVGEDALVEHRITHSEKAAHRVKRWVRKF